MDLDFTEEQDLLRETVRNLCERHASVSIVRALEDDPQGYPLPFWQQLGQLGLTGLLLPEKYGGAGQAMLEGAVLYDELGRSLAPSPHFANAGRCCARAATRRRPNGCRASRAATRSWAPPGSSRRAASARAACSSGPPPTGTASA